MKANSSFSKTVKEEITSKEYKKDRLLAILSSFIKSNGSLLFKNKKEYLLIKTDNSKIAKFIYASLQKIFNITPTISYLTRTNLKKNTSYQIKFINDKYLEKLHLNFLANKIDTYFAHDADMIGGYLAGAFLSSGSVNSPRSSNYHLELSFLNEEYAKCFIRFMNKSEGTSFLAKIIKRREKYIVYLKRSDQIVDFLVLIGATDACLYFENTRVDRDFANIGNRLKNLDTANYQKTIKASMKDIKIFKKLVKKKGLANVGNEKMIELCSLRIKNPEASLSDLAILLSKTLHSEITKSNVNHMLRALREEGRNL